MVTAETTMDLPDLQAASRRRFLFLAHRVPYPPDKGDRIRSFHLLEHLARIGQVDLAYLTDEPSSEQTQAFLGQLCHRVERVSISRAGRWARAAWSLARGRSLTEGLFESPILRGLIGRWLEETPYDAVVCFSSGVLPYVLGRGLDARLIADLVDVDSQKWFDYAGFASRPKAALFRLEGRRVRALERAASRALAVSFVTEAETRIYRAISPEARVVTIPIGVNLDVFRPVAGDDGAGGCVFVGQLDYHANVLGLKWFCREVWPAIRGRLPGATFQIVGRNPVAAVRRLGTVPGIEVIGRVPDVRPYLAAARVVVVPLPVARGAQSKVLEGLAMGKAVVASVETLKGLALVPGRDAFSATDAEDWCRKIAELWDDPGRRAELGENGRKYVELNHCWKTCLGRFDDLIPAGAGIGHAGRGGSTCS